MRAKNGKTLLQRMMEDLLGPVRDCTDRFLDDIIIVSGTEDTSADEWIKAHEKDLRRVPDVLDRHQIDSGRLAPLLLSCRLPVASL